MIYMPTGYLNNLTFSGVRKRSNVFIYVRIIRRVYLIVRHGKMYVIKSFVSNFVFVILETRFSPTSFVRFFFFINRAADRFLKIAVFVTFRWLSY